MQSVFRGYRIRKKMKEVREEYQALVNEIQHDNTQITWKSKYPCYPTFQQPQSKQWNILIEQLDYSLRLLLKRVEYLKAQQK